MRPLLEDYKASGGFHTNLPRIQPYSIAATGSVQGDAAGPLLETFNNVTAADATKGVILPAPSGVGARLYVKNDDTANAVLKVYPATGGKINTGSANAALSMAAKTFALFYSINGTDWETLPLLPS